MAAGAQAPAAPSRLRRFVAVDRPHVRPLASIPRIAASSTVGPSGGIGLRPALPRMGESAGAGREWRKPVVLLDGDVQRAPAALSAAADNSSPCVCSSSRRMRRWCARARSCGSDASSVRSENSSAALSPWAKSASRPSRSGGRLGLGNEALTRVGGGLALLAGARPRHVRKVLEQRHAWSLCRNRPRANRCRTAPP